VTEGSRAPGWYPDPWGAEGEIRYFDGTAWQRNDDRTPAATRPTPRRRRSGLASYVIAALVVAGGIGAFAAGAFDGSSTTSTEPRVLTTSTTVPAPVSSARPGERTKLEDHGYRTGDCVTWTAGAGLVGTEVVGCGTPHRIEIVDAVHLGAEYREYPTRQGWDLIDAAKCGPLVARYLGGPIDPAGPFSTGLLRPFRSTWDQGEHSAWCGIQGRSIDPADPQAAAPFVGRVPHGPPATTGSTS
jgi:hypothetical protein